MNAEIPLRTAIPVSLDLTLRLGKRIKAVAEAIYHPVSFTKMRLSYEYNYNDVNVYEEGARLYNTTYNYHAINWTLLDFNIRNFNVTVGTRWDYYHHGDLLAEIKQIEEGALEVPKDDHYYSYQLRTKYDSENDGYFPTKGAWDRLLPGDLQEKFDMRKKVPLRRVGEHQELANLAAYLVSDYSAYINGEVVTIDGGEWLQGAGEFNMLEQIPQEMWDMLEMMIKAKKKS